MVQTSRKECTTSAFLLRRASFRFCSSDSRAFRTTQQSRLVQASVELSAIMTSGNNDAVTREFIEKNAYFGLPKESVFFFEQSVLPPIDFEGKIFFDTKNSISTQPNGNGAIFEAFSSNKELFNHVESHGIEYLHLIGIDNVINKLLDPVFFGYAFAKQLVCAAKVVPKAHALESVGIFVKRGDLYEMIEYSELGDEMAK